MNAPSRGGFFGLGVFVCLAFLLACAAVIWLAFSASSPDTDPKTTPGTPPGPDPVKPKNDPVPPKAGLDLTFLSSDAKKSWIDGVTAEFNQRAIEVDGQTVAVKVEHVLSGNSAQDILQGRAKPDIWSPGDESWIALVNETWRNVNGKVLFESSTPLVDVPLCLAMWEPMAHALGYPEKPLGWRDLERLSMDPKGWGAQGHPEWGSFKWGHAHPDANSGFLAVASLAYAFFNKSQDLTVGDIKEPALQEFLSRAERSVAHYGLSNSWIDNFMRTKGPSYLSAAVQYENAIIEGNRKNKNQPFKMVAIYPREGAFFTQHPATIPAADWMTPARQAAARKYLEYLVDAPSQKRAVELGLRPIAKGLPVDSVFNPENGVATQLPGIARLKVPPEGVLKRLSELWYAAKQPGSITLIIDTSGSMNGEPIRRAKEGAISFIEKMHSRDELEVIAFNNKINELVPLNSVSQVGESARQMVGGLFANGGTRLHDVIVHAVKRLTLRRQQFPDRHYGLIVLTDGQDEGSSTSRADMFDALPSTEDGLSIKIFTIAYGPKADQQLLKEISSRTNARSFVANEQEIVKVYKELSANF